MDKKVLIISCLYILSCVALQFSGNYANCLVLSDKNGIKLRWTINGNTAQFGVGQ